MGKWTQVDRLGAGGKAARGTAAWGVANGWKWIEKWDKFSLSELTQKKDKNITFSR